MTTPDLPTLSDLLRPLSAKIMPASKRCGSGGMEMTAKTAISAQRRETRQGPKMRPSVRKVQS